MRRVSVILLVLSACLVGTASAATGFEVLSGKAFDQAVVTNFYLEGQAIPAQKRNMVLIKNPAGARALFALLDTSGYGADITRKYNGLLITEGMLSVGGKTIQPGSYGFGLNLINPAGPPTGSKMFTLYNQAGQKVLEYKAFRDELMGRPKPIQIQVRKDNTARLYVGRDWIELK